MPHKKKLTQRQIRGNEPTRFGPKDIQVSSRPTGTPKERNVLLTGKSPIEQEEIQTASALETIAKTDPARAAAIASQSTKNAEILARVKEDTEVSKQLTPEQEKATEAAEPSQQLSEEASGLASAGKAAITGAGTGAAAGAAIGSVVPVLGTAAGGVLGGVLGGAAGFIGGLTSSKRQLVKEAKNLASESDQNFNKILSYVKNGGDPLIARKAWNQQKADILYAERILKDETSNDLKRFLSGGSDELTDVRKTIELFEFYEFNWRLALANPSSLQLPNEQNVEVEQ